MTYRPESPSTRSGIFSAHEQLAFYKHLKGLTQQLMQSTGLASSIRMAREMLNRGVEPQDSRELNRAYRKDFDPPVNAHWAQEIANLRELAYLALPEDANQPGDARAFQRLKTIGATTLAPQELRRQVKSTRDLLRRYRSGKTSGRDDLMHEIGKGYYAGHYCRIMSRLTDNADPRRRIWQKQSAILFGLVFRLLIASNEAETPAGAQLAFKANVNRMSAFWNYTPPSRRSSPHMRRLIDRSKYFERLISYAKLNNIIHYAFNALGIASRFKMRDRYETLHRMLVRSAPEFKDPEQVRNSGRNPLFDSDFDDFIEWWKARKALKTNRSVTSLAAAIIVAITLLSVQPARALEQDGVWFALNMATATPPQVSAWDHRSTNSKRLSPTDTRSGLDMAHVQEIAANQVG
jgi:hypothetical protein